MLIYLCANSDSNCKSNSHFSRCDMPWFGLQAEICFLQTRKMPPCVSSLSQWLPDPRGGLWNCSQLSQWGWGCWGVTAQLHSARQGVQECRRSAVSPTLHRDTMQSARGAQQVFMAPWKPRVGKVWFPMTFPMLLTTGIHQLLVPLRLEGCNYKWL